MGSPWHSAMLTLATLTPEEGDDGMTQDAGLEEGENRNGSNGRTIDVL
jgi:hypothetical protein